MTRRCLIFVCGLFTNAGLNMPLFRHEAGVEGWTKQAGAWAWNNLPDSASDDCTYYADPVGANMRMDMFAANVASIVTRAQGKGWTVELIGHSNGCRIISAMLSNDEKVRDVTVTMLASADLPNCDMNGLNKAARRGQIKRITFGVSPVDEILPRAPFLGYGEMGRIGPTNKCPELRKVMTEPMLRVYRHGQWVSENLVATLQDATT